MVRWLFLLVLAVVSLNGCSGGLTTSTYCALVSAEGKSASDVNTALDPYIESLSLKRSTESPNGVFYVGRENQFIIRVTSIGPLGTEIGFFPQIQNTYAAESIALQKFVMEELTKRFEVSGCDAVEGYEKGTISNYGAIKL